MSFQYNDMQITSPIGFSWQLYITLVTLQKNTSKSKHVQISTWVSNLLKYQGFNSHMPQLCVDVLCGIKLYHLKETINGPINYKVDFTTV